MVTYPISYEVIIWEKLINKIRTNQSVNWYCKQVFICNFHITTLETKHKINLLSNALLSHNLELHNFILCDIIDSEWNETVALLKERKEFYLNVINFFYHISMLYIIFFIYS